MSPPRSLQARLLALLLGALALVWLAAAVLSGRGMRHELDELLDAHLAQAAALLIVQQMGEIAHDDERQLDAPSLHRYAPRAVFQVFHEGQLVLRSSDAPTTPLLPPEASGFVTVHTADGPWRLFAAHGGERDVRVFVGERLDAREHILRAALGGALAPLLLALPVLALLAWWAIRQGLAPLHRLGAALAQRPAQADTPIALDGAPRELRPLLDALNGLLDRINHLLAAERRFSADAAHELRTPIAAIRTQAQVALGEADPLLRQQALQATLQGCDRATRLVEQLLQLARLEAGGALPLQRVDLAEIARSVVAELAPRALAKHQDLSLDAPAPCPLQGDAVLLGVLLRNLVDNAVRYSPAGARVAVQVGREAGGVRLSVEDSGPGLDDVARAQLGQRFRRGLGHDETGSGLGWSIVRRIAEGHGFTLEVAPSAALGGLRVQLRAGG